MATFFEAVPSSLFVEGAKNRGQKATWPSEGHVPGLESCGP